jgi:hypothetical protein
MDLDASSDETALQTSSSDIEDTRQVENDNQDADLTRLSQIDLGNENRRMLKQPLLSPSMDTSINISGTPSATGSEISKENSNTMDDSDVYKYPIGDYQKRKFAQYVARAYQYCNGNMPEWTEKINSMDSKWGRFLIFIDALLRGISQVIIISLYSSMAINGC